MALKSESKIMLLLKNQYISFLLGGLLTFSIAFYPLFVLLTNDNLELGAIIYFMMMYTNIPIGFVFGFGFYRFISRGQHHVFNLTLQILVFICISVTPFLIYSAYTHDQEIKYQAAVNNFAVDAKISNEKIFTRKNTQGDTTVYYDYDITVTNNSSLTFKNVGVSSSLLNKDMKYVATGAGDHILLPPGSKTVQIEIPFYSQTLTGASFTDNMTISITLTDQDTNVYKDFDIPSTLTTWGTVSSQVESLSAKDTPQTGYKRFRNLGKGIQLDYPNGWTSSYGAETGAPPADSENATNHFFSKYDIGSIILQWDKYMENSTLCLDGKKEENISTFMSSFPSFLKTYSQLQLKGVIIRVCVNDTTKISEIQKTLQTLKTIN